jgi:hypothetical protein
VVDDSTKDVSKCLLIDTLHEYSDEIIECNNNYTQRRTYKSQHCDFRLLNVLFGNEHTETILTTSASKTRVDLVALIGALEVSFWERVAEAYNNQENVHFDELLFDATKFSGRVINPRLYHKQSASRLQQMWKNLSKQHNKARRRYQKSVDQCFGLFCVDFQKQ